MNNQKINLLFQDIDFDEEDNEEDFEPDDEELVL